MSTLETSRDCVSKVNSIIPVYGGSFVLDNYFNVTFLLFRLLLQLKEKQSLILQRKFVMKGGPYT